jgi:hypothetical protein
VSDPLFSLDSIYPQCGPCTACVSPLIDGRWSGRCLGARNRPVGFCGGAAARSYLAPDSVECAIGCARPARPPAYGVDPIGLSAQPAWRCCASNHESPMPSLLTAPLPASTAAPQAPADSASVLTPGHSEPSAVDASHRIAAIGGARADGVTLAHSHRREAPQARDTYVRSRVQLGLSESRALALAAGGQVGVGASDQLSGAVLGR